MAVEGKSGRGGRELEQEREELFRRLLDADVAERRRAEASWRLLADAGAALGSSLDPETIAQNVAILATRELADWCLIITRTDVGGLRCESFLHRDPEKAPLGAELESLLGQPGGVPLRASVVLVSGEAQLHREISVDAFEPGAARPAVMRLMRSLGAESAMVVPLQVRQREPAAADGVDFHILGLMLYVSSSPERRYLPRDLLVAAELGRRAALALTNARLYHAAQAAIRHRDEFLSIAAHELRTPLATLQLTFQSMLAVLDNAPVNLEFLRGRALLGERQGVRLSGLINDLVDVSGIQSGQLKIRCERMDLVNAVQTVLRRLQHDEFRGKDIDVAVHAPLPVVGFWDPGRIDRVITHLLTNATKQRRCRPIRIGIHANAEQATMDVQDDGIGMTADILDRMVNPFEGVSTGHAGGSGLGLYIASQILRAHGGTISARSTPDEGSTFTVELPRGTEGKPRQENRITFASEPASEARR